MTKQPMLKGEVSFRRKEFELVPDMFELEIRDPVNTVPIVQALIRVESIGELLSDSVVHCDYAILNTKLIGKRYEYKVEQVPLPNGRWNKSVFRAAMKPFETDGWKGRVEDALTSERKLNNGQLSVAVGFDRWVAVDDGEEEGGDG